MTEDQSPRANRVFRREALDRLRTPEPLDRLVTFAPSATWAGLLGLAWLAAWLVIGIVRGW